MKDSSLEINFPYLAARGDGRGSFVQWLKELSFTLVDQFSVNDIVRWGWIEPLFRVTIPDQYFLAWEEYPSLGGGRGSLLEDSYAWADEFWYSADGPHNFLYVYNISLENEWFIHPFDREEERYRCQISRF